MGRRKIKLEEISHKRRASLTPEELDFMRAYDRQRKKRLYHSDIEEARRRERAKYERRTSRNPDAVRTREKRSMQRKCERNPDYLRRKWKRYAERVKLRTDAHFLMDSVQSLLKKALPVGLPDYVRDDVTSEVLLAILEGKLRIGQVSAKARLYLAAHNIMFDEFATVSLDAPVPGTDGLTYGDRLTYEEETGV